MLKLNYKYLDKFLIEAIPELKDDYEKELKSWKGKSPGQHNVFGIIFNPFLISLFQPIKNEDLLKRVFDFLEKMANSENDEVVNVLQVTVLERIGDDKNILREARKYMGEKTLFYSHEVEKFWGREI